MKRISMIMLLLVAGCASPQYGQQGRNIGQQHNETRREHRLPPLKTNLRLSMAAQKHAEWMAAHSNRLDRGLVHDPDTTNTLTIRVKNVDYKWSYLAENIAYGYDDATLMDGWMDSPGHKANILHKHVTDIGVGIAYSSDNTPYYCVVFGRPA